MKRYLALAEGYSGDDHYGKTTYGVIRYGSEPVVAVLDSERVGETVEGLPVGMQIVAAPWREDLVLAAASEVERATARG